MSTKPSPAISKYLYGQAQSSIDSDLKTSQAHPFTDLAAPLTRHFLDEFFISIPDLG